MEPKARSVLKNVADAELRLPPAVRRWLARWRRSSLAAPADLLVVVGSDAGLHLTRVTRRRNSPPRVTSAFRTVAPDLTPAARDLAERRALASMVAELGAARCPAVAALSGPDVVVRRLTMPAMRPADLRSALELECRRHVNYAVADAEIRFEMLEPVAGKELPVLVVIAPRRRVEERRALLVSAGLRPWAITVPAAGLRADLERRGALDSNEVVAYLDIGSDASQIVVLKGRDIRFSRDLAFGNQTMAAALHQIVVPGVGTVERTPEAAEELLRASGVPLGAEEANFVDGVPLAAVSIMLRPALERLVRDLWNSFDYCNEQFQGEAVSRVVLLGPGARLRNLSAYLGGVLKMPVGGADDPSQRDAVAETDQSGSASAAASGVTLASISRDTLNFAGGSPAEGITWIAEAVPAPAVAAAAALLLVSIAAPVEIQNTQARQRVASLRHGLEELGSQSSAVARFRAARAEEARLEALLARLTGSQVVWSAVLRDLSHRIGADVRLTAVDVIDPAAPAAGPGTAPAAPEPRSLRISGLLRTEGAPAERVLADLLYSLGSSPELDQVRLEGCERVAPSLSGFTLTARLSEKAGS